MGASKSTEKPKKTTYESCKKEQDLKEEKCTINKYIPIELINKTSKSICKIYYQMKESTNCGTGFFMNVDSRKLLVTNYVIFQKIY